MLKKLNKQIQGKKNRAKGSAFERAVRKDLEKKGWVVAKWMNNIDLEKGLVPAKHKFRGMGIPMSIGTGFPDFVCFNIKLTNEVNGVECKHGKYLDKDEKAKCKWLLENKVFHRIVIAFKKERGKINYEDFKLE